MYNSLRLLFIFLPLLVFSQDVPKTYIDSVISIKNDKDFSSFKSMLRKVNSLPSDLSIAKFKYIDSVVKDNDSLRLYANTYHTSTLMRFGKNQEALQLNTKSLKLAESKKWPYFIFENYQLRANIFENLSIIDSTVYYINTAEGVIIRNKLELGHHMARIYTQRAILEQSKGNSEKEDEYMEKVAEVVNAYPNKNMIYYLSTVVYHFKTKKNYQKHAYYSQILKEYKFKKEGISSPKSHLSLSSMLKMDNIEEQIQELKNTFNTSDSLKYTQYLIQIANQLGNKLIEKGDYTEGIYYLNKSISYNEKDKVPYSKLISYLNLYSAQKEMKNYEDAIDALNNYIDVQNEIRSQETLDKVADIEIKYETKKKEAELELIKTKAEKKDKQNQLYLVLLFAGTSFALLLGYFGYKNKQKNTILAKQKDLLENALGEKNTLLKEIHHRVKNSFQIVSSLLYLQSENVDDTEAKNAIKEAENRVRSMILIHQKLYNRDELVGINLQEYIEDLTQDILESHIANQQTITTKLNVTPIVLDIETITPLGLILNELITNVIKHAYKDVDDKLLQINLSEINNELVLEVLDNGNGITKNPSETSFGITLMNALSKKLKAELVFKPRAQVLGTIAKLSIKKYTILS